MEYAAINFQEKFAKFSEHWSPKVIAELNDDQFKLVKVEGEFVCHSHAETDEAFIVFSGEMEIEFREGRVASRRERCMWCRGEWGIGRERRGSVR